MVNVLHSVDEWHRSLRQKLHELYRNVLLFQLEKRLDSYENVLHVGGWKRVPKNYPMILLE